MWLQCSLCTLCTFFTVDIAKFEKKFTFVHSIKLMLFLYSIWIVYVCRLRKKLIMFCVIKSSTMIMCYAWLPCSLFPLSHWSVLSRIVLGLYKQCDYNVHFTHLIHFFTVDIAILEKSVHFCSLYVIYVIFVKFMDYLCL